MSQLERARSAENSDSREKAITLHLHDEEDGTDPSHRPAVDFIHRFLLHVLPPGFVKIRHFGFLANRNRRQDLHLCRSFLPVAPDLSATLLNETQRRAIERRCPFCHHGTLHIIDPIPAQELAALQFLIPADTS